MQNLNKSRAYQHHVSAMPDLHPSMALAGCGGGGSNSQTRAEGPTTTTTTSNETTTTTSTEQDVAGLPFTGSNAPSNYDAPDPGEFMVAAGASVTRGDVVFRCPSGGENCNIKVNSDGTADSTGGHATAELTPEASATLTDDTQTNDATATARADGVFDTLPPETGQHEDAPDMAASPITVGWKDGAVTFTNTAYESGDAPASIGSDWSGVTRTQRLTPDSGTTERKVVIYTDIEGPKDAPFEEVYLYNPETTLKPKYGRVDRMSYRAATGLTRVAEADNPVRLGIASFVPLTGQLDPARFPKRPGTGQPPVVYNYGENNPHPTTFDGTFHGAAGTYTCDGTCTVTAPAGAGEYTFSGTWRFTPNAGAQAKLADVDYLTFGYWVETPARPDADGDYHYEVALVADGSQDYQGEATLPTSGTARYEGNAAGVYATRTTMRGNVQSASSGEFIATANLTATFGSGDTASTLEGEINNFRSNSGNGADGMDKWAVELSRANITDSDSTNAIIANTSAARAFMDSEDSKTMSTTAFWGAALQGPGGTTTSPEAPTGVVGTFSADFSQLDTETDNVKRDARIAGAFGARQVKPPSN